MRRQVILLAAGLGGLAVIGVGLWLWERTRQPSSAEKPEERLLIGFDPRRVERLRMEMGDTRLDRRRQQGQWVPMPGMPDSGLALRIDTLLERLSTLRARLWGDGSKAHGKPLPDKGAVAEIAVWRGGVRPLRMSFFQRGRKVIVRTSDRPGEYEVDASLLEMFRGELKQAAQAAVLASAPDQVTDLRVQTKDGTVHIVRKGGRWFLDDGGVLVSANTNSVGRVLRMIHDLRVRERLGEGGTARDKQGLGAPRHTLIIEAGKTTRLLLGGPCPRDPSGRVAAFGPDGNTVACVGPVEESVLGASLVSDRIFGAGPDEIQAVTVRRGRTTLALVNRPGGGGWSMISPSERPVDQGAAQRLVTDLAELRVRPGQVAAPPERAREVGQVDVTPIVGEAETFELFREGKDQGTLWARRAGGGRWLPLASDADRLLSADPVALRSHALCQIPQEDLLAVMRCQGDGPTELSVLEGGIWHLVLLAGRRGLTEAHRIAVGLERYRPAAKPGERPTDLEWKAPVLHVEEGDAEMRESLIFQAGQVRAKAFVASRATKAHGLERQSLLLASLYRHNCREEAGRKRCDTATCAVELGGPVDGGGCYGRVLPDGAVFVAASELCEVARRPVASRRVTESPLHVLSGVSLTVGRTRLSLVPHETEGWKRRSGSGPAGLAEALLFLAPLRAERVSGYGRAVSGPAVLTASLEQPRLAPVVLRFYASPSGEGYDVVRGDRPQRYRVPSAPVKRLIELIESK